MLFDCFIYYIFLYSIFWKLGFQLTVFFWSARICHDKPFVFALLLLIQNVITLTKAMEHPTSDCHVAFPINLPQAHTCASLCATCVPTGFFSIYLYGCESWKAPELLPSWWKSLVNCSTHTQQWRPSDLCSLKTVCVTHPSSPSSSVSSIFSFL